MPLLHPPSPTFTAETGAEKAVWEALASQLPDDAHLIYGQRITDEGDEVEIDLLVIWPGFGTAVLEVNGGIISLEGGQSMQSRAQGKHQIDSPIEQARRAKHVLIEYMEPRLGASIGACVHMAVFPDTQLPNSWSVPDSPRDLLVDATPLDAVAERIVTALRTHGRHHQPISRTSAGIAVDLLRRTEKTCLNHQLLADMLEDTVNLLSRSTSRPLRLRCWPSSRRRCRRGNGSTPSSGTRGRTSATRGGTRS